MNKLTQLRTGWSGSVRAFSNSSSSSSKSAPAASQAFSTIQSEEQLFNVPKVDRGFKAKTSILIELSRRENRPGSLNRILKVFEKKNINLTHVESKLHCFAYDGLCFAMDLQGDASETHIAEALMEIRKEANAQVDILPAKEVAWFPANLKELDFCVGDISGGDGGGLVNQDHPGFNDKEYLKRRRAIADYANSYQEGDKMSKMDYTVEEIRVWNAVYDKLQDYHKRWACEEYNEIFPELAREAGFGPKQIPQLGDISEYLKSKTGFKLRPVTGLLSARDFLNALAFRTFCSTQYIRHGANPFYTPEPDICHELLGHVPLLADSNFAEFTQEVGLASLGASDEEIVKLASIYWFTVEFGLIKSRADANGEQTIKVMGAGILSSFGEMEWSAAAHPSEECRKMGGIARDYPGLLNPKLMNFDARAAAVQPYPITTYQPVMFCGESLQDVKDRISEYCDNMERSFHPVYNPLTQTVEPSRHIRRLPRSSGTGDLQAQKQKEYFDKIKESRENYSISSVD